MTEQPRESERADQVCEEHDRPESRHIPEHADFLFSQQWQDDGERVLREQLLTTEDDDEKSDAVTELRDEWRPSRLRQMKLQKRFRDHRESHGKPGREPG